MRNLVMCVLVFGLLSCNFMGGPEVDPELQPIIWEFETRYDWEIRSSVKMIPQEKLQEKRPGDEISGLCRKWFDIQTGANEDKFSEIRLRKGGGVVWISEEMETRTEREMTVLHELGHCDFNLAHEPNKIERYGERIPESIMMSSFSGGEKVYERYRNYYWRELWNRKVRVTGTTN